MASTPESLRAWRERIGLTNWDDAAVTLGLSTRTLNAYVMGEREIPYVVSLACRMVERDRTLIRKAP